MPESDPTLSQPTSGWFTVYTTLLESEGLEELQDAFASHVSWCSDMGVESGLPSFQTHWK